MAWKITRITEWTTVSVVVVLAGACLWTNWGTTPEDITGSIPRAPLAAPSATRLPPVISAAASMPAAQLRPPQMNLAAHIIEPGETMTSIARRFNTRAADLAMINRVAADAALRPGATLVVPVYR